MQKQYILLQREMNWSQKYFVNSFNTVWVVNSQDNFGDILEGVYLAKWQTEECNIKWDRVGRAFDNAD